MPVARRPHRQRQGIDRRFYLRRVASSRSSPRLHEALPGHGHRHRQGAARGPGAVPTTSSTSRIPRSVSPPGSGSTRRRPPSPTSRLGRAALFVGGTALYLKYLLYGLFAGPAAHPDSGRASANGTPELHRRLARVDPITAARVHPNDHRRLVRALEIHEVTGRPRPSSAASGNASVPPAPSGSSASDGTAPICTPGSTPGWTG